MNRLLNKSIAALTIAGIMLSGVVIEAKNKKQTPTLNSSNITLQVDEAYTLKVNNVKNKNNKLKWKSSEKDVASVNKKGRIKAKRIGETEITVKLGKRRLKCKVKVANKEKPKPTPINDPMKMGLTDGYLGL